MKIDTKKQNRIKVKERIKFRNFRNLDKGQISVFKSNMYTYAILIDKSGKIIGSVSSHGLKGKKMESAFEVGEKIAKLAISKKMSENIFFNRNGYRFHGRVKALADGARKGGIKF